METEKRSLAGFIKGSSSLLGKKIKAMLDPMYDPSALDSFDQKTVRGCQQGFGKTPYPAQQDAINALLRGYIKQKKHSLALVAEMGTGKTLMGTMVTQALSAHKGRPLRTLIVCPPTLISTWVEEIRDIYGPRAQIVKLTGKNQEVLRILGDCRKNRKVKPLVPTFFVCGWNRMKTGYSWDRVYLSSMKNKVSDSYECPQCGEPLKAPLEYYSGTKRKSCSACGNPFWGPEKTTKPFFAPVLFIKRYLKKYFDCLLVDEVHQVKGGDTIQGAMFGQLAKICPKVLCLTGTLSGGKASDIFYLLQRAIALNLSKEERRMMLPAYSAVQEFAETYGTVEKVYKSVDADVQTGRASKKSQTLKEKPGISPMILRHFFLENAVFLRIADIADQLPEFSEELEFCDMPDELAEEYGRFEMKLKDEAIKALKNNDMTVLGKMLSSLLAWPDFPMQECEITNRKGDIVAYAPSLDIETGKDRRIVELLRDAKSQGRKALVFVEYTGKWAGDTRVAEMLKANGIRPLVMKSTSVPSAKRLDWIRKHFKHNQYDCLICQPKLVEVGLNLREFPEVIFFQTGYSTYVLRQASRRSYRPGQTQEVVVRYLINRKTAQEHAMSLIASKLEASLILEGELSDKGLVALSEGGDNMAAELARSLINEGSLTGLEQTFAAYKMAEAKVSSTSTKKPTPTVTTTTTTTVTETSFQVGNQKAVWKTRSTSTRQVIGQLTSVMGSELSGKLDGKLVKSRGDYIYAKGKRIAEYNLQDNTIMLIHDGCVYEMEEIPAMPGTKSWRVVAG